jgi:hypothetical protein
MGLGFGIRDPGSGKTLFRISDPGSKRHRISGPGSATLASRSMMYGSSGIPCPWSQAKVHFISWCNKETFCVYGKWEKFIPRIFLVFCYALLGTYRSNLSLNSIVILQKLQFFCIGNLMLLALSTVSLIAIILINRQHQHQR